MSSANAFNLDWSTIFSFDKGLMVCYDTFSIIPSLKRKIFISVPMDARVWSGIKWGENMDASNIQSLHIRLVDLKEEMEKLNEDTGGQLLFVSSCRSS